jgi:hypothetical protein
MKSAQTKHITEISDFSKNGDFSNTMKKRDINSEAKEEPEWQGFPFLPPAESEEEEEAVAPVSKKKKRNKKDKSPSSPQNNDEPVAKTMPLRGVMGGMFGAFVNPPSKSKKQKKTIVGSEYRNDSPAAHSSSSALATPTIEEDVPLAVDEEPYTIWRGEARKFKRGNSMSSNNSSSISNSSSSNIVSNRSPSKKEWVVIALSDNEQLCCVGSARVTCLKGRVEVLGLMIDARQLFGGVTAVVHSPSWYGATVLKAAASSESDNHDATADSSSSYSAFLSSLLSDHELTLLFAHPVVLFIESFPDNTPALYTAVSDGNDANRQQLQQSNLLHFHEVPCKDLAIAGWCIIHRQSKVAASTSVLNISIPWVEAADRIVTEHENMLNSCMLKGLTTTSTTTTTKKKKEKDAHDVDEDLISTSALRIMVCGSKGVGKSTFVRYGIIIIPFFFNTHRHTHKRMNKYIYIILTHICIVVCVCAFFFQMFHLI